MKKSKYESLSTALESHEFCHPTCDTIHQFSDGCSGSSQLIDGLTKFTNFFSVGDCEPEVTEHHNDNGWIEEYKIFVGYDDLTIQLPGGQEAILDVHKVSQYIHFDLIKVLINI